MKFEDFVIYRIIRDFLFFRNDELSDLFFEWKFESDLLFRRILLKQEYLKLILSIENLSSPVCCQILQEIMLV